MAGNFKMPSKKTAIVAGIVVAILAIIAVTGTVVFLKDRGSTEAADLENSQVSREATETTSNNQGSQIQETQNGEAQSGEQTGAEANAQNANQGDAQTNNDGVINEGTAPTGGTPVANGNQNTQTTGNAGNTGRRNNNGTTTVDNIQETEITENQTTTVQTGTNGLYLSWEQSKVDTDKIGSIADKINAQEDDIDIEKTATTKTGEDIVTRGETIKYTIKVTSSKELKNIEVKDTVPEQTSFTSADNDGEEREGMVIWNVDLEEKDGKYEKVLTFEVTVDTTAEGTIENSGVIANGTKMDEDDGTKTAVIVPEKTAVVEGRKDNVARVNDKITYTISVKNTSEDVDVTTEVKDDSIKSLVDNGTLEIEENSKTIVNQLSEGIKDVEIKAGETYTVKFTAIVKSVDGEIKNVAKIGEKDTENTIDTIDYEVEKKLVSYKDVTANTIIEVNEDNKEDIKVDIDDVLTYEVTVTNKGSKTLNGIKVNDPIAEEGTQTIDEIETGKSETVTFTYTVVEKDIAAGKILNTATVTVPGEEPKTATDENSTEQNHKLTILYVYEEDKKEAHEKYEKEYKYNENYEVTSPDVTGHSPNKEKVSGTMPEKDTTITVFYTRNSYQLTINYVNEDGKVLADKVEETLKYEDEYSKTSPEIKGYTPNKAEVKGTMPASDVEETVVYTANTDTKYKVEYYYQQDDGRYPETASKNTERTGTTDTTAKVNEKDTTPETVEGKVYVFDESNTSNKLEGNINGDGSLVLKVYFKQQYTVTYNKGNHGTFDNQATSALDYGVATPTFNGEKTAQDGFYFAGWDKDIASTVTKNETYTAQWEGLEITKTRTGIIDRDGKSDVTYIDQDGDKITYDIEIENKGDLPKGEITLTDNHNVKVTAVSKNGEAITVYSEEVITAGNNLLAGITSTLQNTGDKLTVSVEYTVTKAEISTALAGDGKIVNTATAVLNNHSYTANDTANGTEGTEVKQRANYTVKYYTNNVKRESETHEAPVGAIVTYDSTIVEKYENEGYTFIEATGDTTVKQDGTTLIQVYLGKAELEINKQVLTTGTVKAGDNIEYKITVTNKGYVASDAITITDELQGTTYVEDSASLKPTVTTNSNNNQVLTWNLSKLEATGKEGAIQEITYKVAVPRNVIGHTIQNTATIVGTTLSSSASKKISEVKVDYQEVTEGQKATDLNIIFVIDNSSSMNETIAGESFVNTDDAAPVAPDDRSKTRIYNAKQAIQQFISKQTNPNNTMTVIKFNAENNEYPAILKTEGTGYEVNNNNGTKTISVDGEKIDLIGKYEYWYQRIYTGTAKNGEKYVIATDGKAYKYTKESTTQGASVVGSTLNGSLNNSGLSSAVSNMTIGDAQYGFGTYVNPAFKLINDNASTYISSTKKNIVIVLADGGFNGNYSSQLTTLKSKVDDIYCIGFGSDYNATALSNMSTNNTCYTATNSTDLLDVFNGIEDAAGKPVNGETTEGTIELNQASKTVKVSNSCPLTIEDVTTGNTIVTCTSTSDFAKYGLSLSADGKTITWNANEFAENNQSVAIPSEVKLKYYIGHE